LPHTPLGELTALLRPIAVLREGVGPWERGKGTGRKRREVGEEKGGEGNKKERKGERREGGEGEKKGEGRRRGKGGDGE